jgi:hypothetical protein
MKPNPELGNRIILLAAALGLAVASLFATWGLTPLGSGPGALHIRTDGRDGVIEGLGISVPAWMACSVVCFGLLVSMANAAGFSSISRRVLSWVFIIGGIVLPVWQLWRMLGVSVLGIGAFLLIGAAGMGLWLQRRRMSSF